MFKQHQERKKKDKGPKCRKGKGKKQPWPKRVKKGREKGVEKQEIRDYWWSQKKQESTTFHWLMTVTVLIKQRYARIRQRWERKGVKQKGLEKKRFLNSSHFLLICSVLPCFFPLLSCPVQIHHLTPKDKKTLSRKQEEAKPILFQQSMLNRVHRLSDLISLTKGMNEKRPEGRWKQTAYFTAPVIQFPPSYSLLTRAAPGTPADLAHKANADREQHGTPQTPVHCPSGI